MIDLILLERLGQQHLRTSVRAPKLDSIDPETFCIWKTDFATTVAVNEWNIRVQKDGPSGLEGPVAQRLHDIPLIIQMPKIQKN